MSDTTDDDSSNAAGQMHSFLRIKKLTGLMIFPGTQNISINGKE
ncbi:MAG: hypothetical protein WDN26_03635 [Chitinophagaceae bacterium]